MNLSGRVIGLFGNKENVINLFLAGGFLALGLRSVSQQKDIDALEAEKASLRSSNKAMNKAMWDWRQILVHLVEADPSNSPISLSRLRAIYGEVDQEDSNTLPSPLPLPDVAGIDEEPNPSSMPAAIAV